MSSTWILILILILIIIAWIAYKWYTSNKNTQPNILYYFYSPSCGFCRQFEPTWTKIVEDLQDSATAPLSVNVALPENQQLANKYDINAVPTLVYTNGQTHRKYSGPLTQDKILAFVYS